MDRSSVISLLGQDWERVKELLRSTLSSDVPLLDEINTSLQANAGKMLRPMVSLLVARACNGGNSTEESIRTAAAVEVLHNATLLHDDVADEAMTRRGTPTVMSRMGAVPAVLGGDFWLASAVPLLKEDDSLLITQTFSKSRSLAGGRLGFTVAGPALAEDMNTLKFSFNPYNVNRVTMLMGEHAMRDREYFEDCRRKIVEAREWTKERLRGLGFTVTDSRANFLFVTSPDIGGKEYYRALRERGILVRRFDIPRIADWCRITVGTREQMERLAEATEDILKGVKQA